MCYRVRARDAPERVIRRTTEIRLYRKETLELHKIALITRFLGGLI